MKKIGIIILLGSLMLSFGLSKSAIKKMDKTIASIWPEQIISRTPINLSETEQNKLSFSLNNNTLYKLSKSNETTAYLYLSAAKSKISHFDYMVVFKPDLTILKVKV